MIQKEFYRTREDGVNLHRTYSDNNKYIQKVGTEEIYSEAIDVEHAKYEYIETDKDIPIYEEELEETNENGEIIEDAEIIEEENN